MMTEERSTTSEGNVSVSPGPDAGTVPGHGDNSIDRGHTSTDLGKITLEAAVSEDDTDSAREDIDNGEAIEADTVCQDENSFNDANYFPETEEDIPDSSPICEIGMYYCLSKK